MNQKKIDTEFSRAVKLYDAREFISALSGFEKIINEYDLNSKTTAAYFFTIKILIEKKEYEGAWKLITEFLENYPSSKYTEEIRILFVKLNLDNYEYYDALKEIAFLIARTKSILYRLDAKDIGEKIARNYLSSSDLKKLSDSFTSDKVKPYLLLLLAKSYFKEKERENALVTLSQILQKYPSSEESAEAKNLYDNPIVPDEESGGKSYIGVLLPLQNDENDYPTSAAADEILQGVKFAVAEFNKGRDVKIGIIIRDTKNNEDEINEIRNELGSNSSIKVILGPIFSNEVRVTIKTFNGTNLLIISPTATDNDLTAVSENFFQANPPLAVRGKIMAQYVFFVENKKNMAVLNSIDGYSPLIAASFIEEFEKLGGTIKVKETYKSNSFSLSEPISRIVAVDILLEAPDTLQGIYIPLADKVDATAILSQMGQDSLYLPIFGNQDWFSARGFESAPGLSNMLTFSSDYFIDFNDNDYQEFSERFSKVYGKDPGRNVLYGYDVAKYLLTVMANIVPGRLAIKNKILSGMVSNGYHNNISFDENRVNRFLNIVRYRDGVFELIEKFHSGN
ncbi:MAG: ABC transporter substrate-binding protein [Bacteroidetes bacterium]|nr:ABC transporter substrate-binding protein [Bacteroidota bacterium]